MILQTMYMKELDVRSTGLGRRNYWEKTWKYWRDCDRKANLFYTSAYRALHVDFIFQDSDGRFTGLNRDTAAEGFAGYAVFSLWDTYRASGLTCSAGGEPDRLVYVLTSFCGMWREVASYPDYATQR